MTENEIITQKDPQMQIFSQLMEGGKATLI